MTEQKRITAPFTEETVQNLKAGDTVLITGVIYAARDAAHQRLFETLSRGEELPVDLKGQVVYYVGPSPAKPGDPIGSAGPTTAGRCDAYTPALLDYGLKGMIGKGYRSPAVVDSMIKNGVAYLVTVGGAAALIARSVKSYQVVAYPDLGPEAIARMEVVDFPAIVAIDHEGNNFYDVGQAKYRRL